MIQGMLIYNTGSGDVEFTPTYPALKKAFGAGGLSATRHDSVATAGNKQSRLENIATLNPLTFPICPASDMPSWILFLNYALAGGVFAYRPNAADNTVWYEYTLDSMAAPFKFVSFGVFAVDLQCRLWVGATVVSGS
jgi:hypothetical protein